MTTLRKVRKSIGKTQNELARILGVSQARVSKIETTRLTDRQRERFARALGVPSKVLD